MIKRDYFLKKAEENTPPLFFEKIFPKSEKTIFLKGDSVLLDLGNHYVGHFSFDLDVVDDFFSAPVKVSIRFGEDMREIHDDHSQYRGTLSSSWLQEETFVLDHPQRFQLPRRYSCRYVQITVLETRRKTYLGNFVFTASSSANLSRLAPILTKDEELKEIDRVSCYTLKECMQSVFEDGPKRDRRLWTGDLRLEALANYHTFQNDALVRRCLYLLAAGDTNELGFLPSFIYETPRFYNGSSFLIDYALLFVVTLCDYYENTKDLQTVRDLLPVCKEQLNSFYRILDEDGVVAPQKGWYFFIDWCPGLRGRTALQGVYLYTLKRFVRLLYALDDKEKDFYEKEWADRKRISKDRLFNEEEGIFLNDADDGQRSVHSQVWMILGEALRGDEAKDALKKTMNQKDVLQPFTPYMRHYILEAMFLLGMKEEAVAYMKEIWGAMIRSGADTFYEVFVPGDPDFSPYKDRMINSLCHAWSCTPCYFIRKYLT